MVIVEAALAGAIEAFGERMPRAVQQAVRLPRLDAATDGPQADIARITIAGMAMIVGRPLDPSEEIDPLSPVVQEVVEVAAVRAGDLFAAAFTPWLDRAISLDPLLGFSDFADAAADLEEIVPPGDDLVEEILRRGAEPDLPDGSDTTDDLFADLPSVPEVIDDASEPAAAPYVFEDAPTEPPVDEPPADEPPVDEPVPDEPPAEEPPAYDPPVQDPPAEEPSEETPPMWVRAAIEKMARTRQERPAAPAPRPADMRGPVFEISEEPEHELAAETTTLSDIERADAREQGARLAPDTDGGSRTGSGRGDQHHRGAGAKAAGGGAAAAADAVRPASPQN